jgi:uncharacterized membrane protein HdeD (DUF308 family)
MESSSTTPPPDPTSTAPSGMTATAVQSAPTLNTPWWVVLIAGVALAITGLLLLSAPGATVVTLVQVLGVYWLVDGIVKLVSIFIDRRGWGWKLAIGILGIIAGLVVIQHPLWAAILVPATLVLTLALAGLVIGVLEIVQAFTGAGWGTGILGAVSVLFGLLLLLNPGPGAVGLVFAFGILGIVGGVAAAIMAFRLKSAS